VFVARGRVWEKDVLVNKRTVVVVLNAAIEALGETEHLDEMSIRSAVHTGTLRSNRSSRSTASLTNYCGRFQTFQSFKRFTLFKTLNSEMQPGQKWRYSGFA
jgi:hypothetical protein